MKKLLLLFLFFFFLSLFSETILLKTGQTLKVKLISQNADSVVYSQGGKEVNLEKNKIRKIIYARTPELEELQVKDELKKFNQEKLKKIKKTKQEEDEEARLLEEEFNKAIEEQERQERLNMSFEERITKLENDILKTRTQMSSMDPSSYSGAKLRRMEADIEDLKTRTKRIEKFLEIDPNIEEYYNSPRSMWQIVWRSAVFPGWGLNYGKGKFGTFYSSMFFLTTLSSIGYKEYLKDQQNDLQNRVVSDLIVQPLAVNSLLRSSSLADSSTVLSDFNSYQTYNNTVKGLSILEKYNTHQTGIQRSDSLMKAGIAIYIIQLVHSGIYGYFWEKNPPKQFLREEEKSEDSEPESNGAWNFQIFPGLERQPAVGSNTAGNRSWNLQMGYTFQF